MSFKGIAKSNEDFADAVRKGIRDEVKEVVTAAVAEGFKVAIAELNKAESGEVSKSATQGFEHCDDADNSGSYI